MTRINKKKMMERDGFAWCNWGQHWLPATTEYFNADKTADNGIRTGYCKTCRKLHRRGIRPATPRNTFHGATHDHGLDGVCDKIFAETEDGEKVMIKAGYEGFAPDEPMIAERFAYTLGKMLGLNVNEVQIIDFGQELGLDAPYASVHYWEDDFKMAAEVFDLPGRDHPEKLKMRLLDEIIDNGDRHHGNWGMSNGELFMIDHGHAGPWNPMRFRGLHPDVKWAIYNVNEVQKMAKKFVALTEQDFRSMLSGLDHIPYATDRIERVIRRMREMQDMVRETLEYWEVAV